MPTPWQLPPGVSAGMWDYLHDPAIARGYDQALAGTALLDFDRDFVVHHCPTPGRFLDLGCGTGRLAISMAQRGHQVLAVDLSAEMLRIVGEKAAAAQANVHRLQANLVDLACLADGSFDNAACLFGTLGMIQGRPNRQRFLAHVFRLLKPGGVFVLHVHNRWFHLWTRHGRRLLRGNWWRWLRGREELGDFHMPPDQGLGSWPMHLFSRRELQRELRRVGFTLIQVRPISLAADGRLRCPCWLGGLRAYGFLVAARSAL